MPQIPALEYINVSGKVEVLVAFPLTTYVTPLWPFSPTRANTPSNPTSNAQAYTYLFKLGEVEDMVQPTKTPIINEVHGDRHGGRNGAPIEEQDLGHISSFDLTLSRWDRDVLRMIESIGGLRPFTNKIPLNTVGALTLRDRSMRFLLYCVGNPSMSRNYPCCIVKNRRSVSLGTKFSVLNLNITANRAAEGHWGTQVTGNDINSVTDLVTGFVENGDTTGVADPYIAT